MGDGRELAIKVVLMLPTDVGLEVVAGDHQVSLKEDANGVVNSCTPGNQLGVVFIKLVVKFVNVTTNSCCIYSHQLQVVTQGLRGSNGVDGGQLHDDFVHEGCVLHPIKCVLFLYVRSLACAFAVNEFARQMLITCCFALRKSRHPAIQACKISYTQS